MSSIQVQYRDRQRSALIRWSWVVGLMAAVCMSSMPCSAAPPETKKAEKEAKTKAKTKAPAKAAGKAAAKTEDEAIPESQDVTLTTEDGLKLKLTYFPGTKGKDSIPVILLHPFKGSGKDFAKEGGLALYLQEKLGCAVIVPDLRGHGGSTSAKVGRKTETLKAEKLQPRQFASMVTQDLLAVKNFLWEKNNEEELNIDKLCVVGVEMGASVALDFALLDSVGYEQNTAKYGPLQLGLFVKALVLISPDWAFRGLNTRKTLTSPRVRGEIPVMILVGKGNAKCLGDAERFYKTFSQFHRTTDDDENSLQTLWFKSLDTSLEGMKLLDESSFDVPPHKRVGQFIYYHLIKNPEAKKLVWKERKLPHE